MLVAIKSCEAHWDRCSAIRDTWAKDSEIVRAFTGWQLDVSDSYEALPQKTRAICKWALKRGHLNVFFCDTDTYVCLPRLKPPEHDYVGYKLPDKGYASGGAGYWLSRKAMEYVAQFENDMFDYEDEMVGAAMAIADIELVHDPRYALYDDVLPGNEVISRHLSSRGPFKVEMMYLAHEAANGKARS